MATQLAKGLEYLTVLGPGKVIVLLSTMPGDKLAYLSRHIEHKRILKVLAECSVRQVSAIARKTEAEALVALMNGLEPHVSIELLNQLEADTITQFLTHLESGRLIRIITGIGVTSMINLLGAIGPERSLLLARELDPQSLIGLVKKVPMSDLAPLALRLKVNFLRELMRTDTAENLAFLIKSVGYRNILELVHFLGDAETIHLTKRLKAKKMQQLIFFIHQMKLKKPKAVTKKPAKPKKKTTKRKSL